MEPRKFAVGVDLSLTGSAVSIYYEPENINVLGTPVTKRFTTEPSHGLTGRLQRYIRIRNAVCGFISDHGVPSMLFIEGYSMGSKSSSMLDLAELGSLVRVPLCKMCGVNIREVPPNTLKQFATGKGQCRKEFVMACVAQRYDMIFGSNDECDAFVLSRMAACALGWTKVGNEHQKKALHVAMNPKPPNRGGKKKKVTDDES